MEDWLEDKKEPAEPIKNKKRILDIQQYLRENGRYGERNYILFITGITTGYRTGDLLELRVRDVKRALKNGKFKILESKKEHSGNIKKRNIKPRTVIIQPGLARELIKYIEGKKDYDVMFESNKGRNTPIEVSQVSRILREAGRVFGLDNISSHSMRKTYAYTVYIENDRDINLVQEMLGHSSPEITKRYIGLDNDVKAKASKCLNGLIG